MVIFHSYVKLPEGRSRFTPKSGSRVLARRGAPDNALFLPKRPRGSHPKHHKAWPSLERVVVVETPENGGIVILLKYR